MVDVLSGGRLELGVGRGTSPTQFEEFGVPWEERHARFGEALRSIEGAWAGGPPFQEGERYRLGGVEAVPEPVQKPRPPVHVAANDPETAAFAGRGGHGMVMGAAIHPLPDAFSAHIRRYREGLAQAEEGRAKLPRSGPISSAFWVFCAKDKAEVRVRFERSLRRNHPVGRRLPWEAAEEKMAVFGSPEECAEKISAIEHETGLDRMLCHFKPGVLIPHRAVLDAMKLFSREVLPFLRPPGRGTAEDGRGRDANAEARG